LTRIESEAFHDSLHAFILIPSTILFIVSDAVDDPSQIRFIDGDSCPGFDRWLQLKSQGIAIDFRRIQRVGFDIPYLGDYIINLLAFEEKSMIYESDEVSNQIYHRIEDQLLVFMKSKPLWENVQKSQFEKLINLRHPCIGCPIGFVFPIESGSSHELKIVRLYLEGCSLSEVVSVNPIWWTPTVKAKTIAGIVLGLQYAHSLELLHGHLTGNNILFDSDHCIQIVGFTPNLDGFSGEGWTPEKDIVAFVSILSEIVFGNPPQDKSAIPTVIPDFVSNIIGLAPLRPFQKSYTFNIILESLKENNFQIEDGVDSAEVSEFVNWVESED
jgi:serine/threonine protein kinase